MRAGPPFRCLQHGCSLTKPAPLLSSHIDPVNEAPFIVSPDVTLGAYRNTPLQYLAFGLTPSGQPSSTDDPLFQDPDNDTMTLAMLSPPALGRASVDSATGVLNYVPPYMKRKDPDGLTTSLVLQASDPSGLKSPALNVSIVIGEPYACTVCRLGNSFPAMWPACKHFACR